MGSSHSCLSTPFLHRYHRSTDRSVDQPVDVRNAMNINRASEDELLLLPGITSSIAQNLVEYRQRVGGFKQTDEMLRVNGMNGKIFQRIRSDISLGVPPVSAEDQHSNLINLNLASHDELCSLPGLTPILVQRILQRRERKGNFRFIEDLLQIKGIDYFVLARIRSRLTVEQQRSQSSLNYSSTNNLGPAISSDTLSLASLLVETLPPEVQTLLRSSLPRRPAVKDPLAPSGFRFASWNLQQLTVEKVRNPGVREVICRTILDHNVALIGIQDIASKEALDILTQELNHPTIPSLKETSTRPGSRQWKSVISDMTDREQEGSEYLGFLYNESSGIALQHASLLPLEKCLTQLPFMAVFRLAEKFEFVFVNLHLKAHHPDERIDTKDEAASFAVLAQTIHDTTKQKAVILLGDFHLPSTSPVFESLIKDDYSAVIEDDTNTSSKTSNASVYLDNIWLSATAKTFQTSPATPHHHSGVIRDNLTSVWIPAGWSWGGFVSDHCPVWTELNLS